MEAWFDHQIFVLQRFGGYTRYFVELARALRAAGAVQPCITAPAHVCELIRPDDPLHPCTFALRRPSLGQRFRPALVAPLFRALATLGRPDVIHETHHVLLGAHLPRGTASIATCHDMILETRSDGSPAARASIEHKRQALARARRIICVSRSTQADLARFYPDLTARSTVIHHGVRALPEGDGPVWRPTPQPFVLFVGVRRGYKNFPRALRALAATGFLSGGGCLVCFGGGPLNTDERALCAELKVDAGQLHCLEGSDDQLAACYRAALLLLFPSEHEGFGMPLTEAMVYGCPIACSRIACFTEVCEDAAAYFDPSDTGSMTEVLSTVLGSPSMRQSLAERGTRRGQDFSWQRCAEATAACYAS